jgi:hypothetical protein
MVKCKPTLIVGKRNIIILTYLVLQFNVWADIITLHVDKG